MKAKEHEGWTERMQNEENLDRDKNGGTNGLSRLGELRGVHLAKINGAEWELRRPGSSVGFIYVGKSLSCRKWEAGMEGGGF